jgi:hypothetical protein
MVHGPFPVGVRESRQATVPEHRQYRRFPKIKRNPTASGFALQRSARRLAKDRTSLKPAEWPDRPCAAYVGEKHKSFKRESASRPLHILDRGLK